MLAVLWRGGDTVPKIARFVLVGGGLAGLFFTLSLGAVWLRLTQIWVTPVVYAITCVVGYTLQRGWTFRAQHAHRRSLPRYLVVQVGCAMFSAAIAGGSLAMFGGQALYRTAFTTVAASVVSLLASLFWIFPASRQHVPDGPDQTEPPADP